MTNQEIRAEFFEKSLETIFTWKHTWAAQADYTRQAMGVDANMKHSLANLMADELLRAYNLGARKMNDSAAKAVENMQADWADNDRKTNAYAFATKAIQEIRALLPPSDDR